MITNLKPDVYNFLAIDIGASSGRAILASIDTQGNVITREIHRFTHPIVRTSGQCYWDIYFLYEQIIESLKRVAEEGIRLTSIGIDTWGVDFVLCSNTGEILRQPYSYRDPQTKGVSERYFQEQLSANELYRKTGIQVMDFNTVFQLYALRLRHDQVLQMADKILFMSDALSYMLTGNMVMEYTIASTSGMINAQTKELDEDILRTLSLTRQHFAPMVQPGSVIGMLLPEIRQVTGVNEVPVVAVAGHDTASAVAAVKAMNEHFAYLSSGTWSLMGIVSPRPIINAKTEKYNFTNEGGVNGTVRVLKNICGMWLLERCRQEWNQVLPYDELFGEVAKAKGGRSVINPDDERLKNPVSMIKTIQTICSETGQPIPETEIEITRCILDSLAMRYKEVVNELREIAPFEIDTLYVIGGGAKNKLLNRLTAEATGLKVITGNTEATAMGNIFLQIQTKTLKQI